VLCAGGRGMPDGCTVVDGPHLLSKTLLGAFQRYGFAGCLGRKEGRSSPKGIALAVATAVATALKVVRRCPLEVVVRLSSCFSGKGAAASVR
jgi:hypothetical protein